MIPSLLSRALTIVALFVFATESPAQNVRENNALKRIETAAERMEVGQRTDPEKIQSDVASMRHLEGPGGRRFEEALCRLLGAAWPHKDKADVRAVASMALSDLQSRLKGGEKDAARRHVAELALATASESPATRLGAVIALGRVERAARPAPKKLDVKKKSDAEKEKQEPPEEEDPRLIEALQKAVVDPVPAVRNAALDAIVGQSSPRATELLGESLAELFEATPPTDAKLRAEHDRAVVAAVDRLRHHVVARESKDVALPEAIASRLTGPLTTAWMSPEWHIASRAVALVPVLPAEAVAAPLVDALEVWTKRAKEAGKGIPTGVDRLRYEIMAALQTRFNATIGLSVQRWRGWLEWYQKGGSERVTAVDENTTVTQFFGLELRSSAVLFILDTSGSMAWDLEGKTVTGRDAPPTRYDLALEQLQAVLEREDNPIWFDVVCFDTDLRRMPKGPKLSTPAEVKNLIAWLRSRPPSGGTQLEKGLAAAWPKGMRNPFYDTVVVLCDGETTVTREDAMAWLDSGPLDAGIIVHSVQIGPDQATSLETLAEGSGGRFLRITAQ